jgi:predicted transposase YdaD
MSWQVVREYFEPIRAGGLAGVSGWGLKTDHWFYGLFQSAPDLIALLLPPGASAAPELGPGASGDALYRFEAPELKAANHRLDGAFWPKSGEAGTPDRPVVLLEVQMHSKPGFKHRLGAQSFRFLQIHPQVLHLAVVVVVPHRRLKLGPAQLPQQLQAFLDGVIWLTLPVRSEAVLVASSQQILVRRPDLFPAVQTISLERLPLLTREDLMEIATIPAKDLRHTRVAQEWIEEGRLEGAAQGEAKVMLRQLNRRCGPLADVTTARIQALPLEQLEALAEALLDFSGPADLAAWLEEHKG